MDGLARALNIQKSRVGMWETNGTVPRQDMLGQLCKFFNVSADYLLGTDTIGGTNPVNTRITAIQRGLSQLNESDLAKAENMLRAVFADAFGGSN